MKKLYTIVLIGFGLFMAACTYNHRLEQTLQKAGSNRAELEKVLVHYKNDKKKNEATRFLLENMAECHTTVAPLIDSLKVLKRMITEHGMDTDWADSVDNAWKGKSYGKSQKVYDAEVITAQYLIENIDMAFEVWEKQPWAKHYSFDEFCRYILPYRIGDEPLEDWRKMYYEKYAKKVDSIYSGSDIVKKIQAVRTVFKDEGFSWNDKLPEMPHFGATYLFNNRLGGCLESCDYSVYLLRALGIPAVTDSYLMSPHTTGGHFWTAVRDTTGLLVPFWLLETEVIRGGSDGRAKGKVYREEFGGVLRDVTADYFGKNQAEITIACPDDVKRIYLCVFSKREHIPVAETERRGKKAIFKNLEPGIRFIPVYYTRENIQKFAGYPFAIDSVGKTMSYMPDTLKTRKVTLWRKYPHHNYEKERLYRMAGTRLEGSMYADFRDAQPLFILPLHPRSCRQTIQAEKHTEVRYIRWIAKPVKHSVMAAEIAFYDKKDGKSIPYVLKHIPEPDGRLFDADKMQDEDVLTCYQAKKDGEHTLTFDLGKPCHLGSMLYVPRNDDNYIASGEEYELFYHNGTEGWKSLGKQTAISDSLIYDNIPSNVILWLRNLTKGKEEQQFIINENMEQEFH